MYYTPCITPHVPPLAYHIYTKLTNQHCFQTRYTIIYTLCVNYVLDMAYYVYIWHTLWGKYPYKADISANMLAIVLNSWHIHCYHGYSTGKKLFKIQSKDRSNGKSKNTLKSQFNIQSIAKRLQIRTVSD